MDCDCAVFLCLTLKDSDWESKRLQRVRMHCSVWLCFDLKETKAKFWNESKHSKCPLIQNMRVCVCGLWQDMTRKRQSWRRATQLRRRKNPLDLGFKNTDLMEAHRTRMTTPLSLLTSSQGKLRSMESDTYLTTVSEWEGMIRPLFHLSGCFPSSSSYCKTPFRLCFKRRHVFAASHPSSLHSVTIAITLLSEIAWKLRSDSRTSVLENKNTLLRCKFVWVCKPLKQLWLPSRRQFHTSQTQGVGILLQQFAKVLISRVSGEVPYLL